MNPPAGFAQALETAFRAAGLPPPRSWSLDPVPGGSINMAFQVRTASVSFFCKWNPEAPIGFFAREAEGLEALRAAGAPLILPRVLASTPEAAAPGPALLALEWLDAVAPGPGTWEALGRGLARLHAVPQREFGWDRDNYCGLTPQRNVWSADWAAFYAERRIAPLVDFLARTGAISAGENRLFGRLLGRLPGLLPHRPVPSLIHGDLWSGNFLGTGAGPALVDPAAHCADAEAEWAMMALFGGFPGSVREAYEEVRPLPAGWRERLPLYQLYPLLNHAALFGGGYPARAAEIARRYA